MAELPGPGNLGRVYWDLGRADDALACFEQSLQYARQFGDINLKGMPSTRFGVIDSEIGITNLDQKRIEEGRAAAERALKRTASFFGNGRPLMNAMSGPVVAAPRTPVLDTATTVTAMINPGALLASHSPPASHGQWDFLRRIQTISGGRSIR